MIHLKAILFLQEHDLCNLSSSWIDVHMAQTPFEASRFRLPKYTRDIIESNQVWVYLTCKKDTRARASSIIRAWAQVQCLLIELKLDSHRFKSRAQVNASLIELDRVQVKKFYFLDKFWVKRYYSPLKFFIRLEPFCKFNHSFGHNDNFIIVIIYSRIKI